MTSASSAIRNLGIVAHINAGKTTLSERVLFDTGVQRFLGEVDDGTATMDYLPQEQQRGISIRAACATVPWRGCSINLIDTPGHVDFGGEVERALRVLDGVVVVLDGVRGVESQTEAIWRQVRARELPAMAFINKLDRATADWPRCLDALRARLNVRALPVVVPLRGEAGLVGLHDVIGGRRDEWQPGGALLADPLQARDALVEVAADVDADIMAAFVAGAPVADAPLRAALRRAVLARQVVLVCAGAALTNRGVEWLLDAVVEFLPAPTDREPGLDPGAPVAADVFARLREPRDAVAVRLRRGAVAPGVVLDGSDGVTRTVVEVLRVQAADSHPVAAAQAGDVVGLRLRGPLPAVGIGLHAPGHRVEPEAWRAPAPVLAVALEPRQSEHRAAIEVGARELCAADPTLALRFDPQREVWLLVGMGELHLDVACEQLRAAIGDCFRVGLPEVDCRESVARRGAGEGEWRQPELGLRAVVALRLDAVPGAGAPLVGAVAALGGDGLVERLLVALRGVLSVGLVSGWPAIDLGLEVERCIADGPAGADLLPVALEAARVALRRALAEAEPCLLEPWVAVQVECPHDALSPILADLRGKGAAIDEVDADAERSFVRGRAPLGRMLGYATRLRSISKGLATFAMTSLGHRRT